MRCCPTHLRPFDDESKCRSGRRKGPRENRAHEGLDHGGVANEHDCGMENSRFQTFKASKGVGLFMFGDGEFDRFHSFRLRLSWSSAEEESPSQKSHMWVEFRGTDEADSSPIPNVGVRQVVNDLRAIKAKSAPPYTAHGYLSLICHCQCQTANAAAGVPVHKAPVQSRQPGGRGGIAATAGQAGNRPCCVCYRPQQRLRSSRRK